MHLSHSATPAHAHHERCWAWATHRFAPPEVRYWLTLRSSLTDALRKLSNDDLYVEVLRQYWSIPLASERRALGIDWRHRCLIREVCLVGCGTRWVFARSILPASTLVGPLRRLRRLDDRPLGEILFADRRIRRGALQAALLHPQDPALATLGKRTTRHLWARRSVFSLHRRNLLVAEAFLPDFPYHRLRSYNGR